jgi:uncharacterized iron-regulated membrane protein
MKRCRFCAEDVKDEALVCRYCGRWLDARRISRGKRRWIYANNVLGSIIFFMLFFALFGAAIAEFTGIGGGFATIAEPFSQIRNQIAAGYAAIGAVLGFAIGALHGGAVARSKLNHIQCGDEPIC